ncbi:MAG: T9SS type A sorting domain-containing protein [Ignavibacteriales bacterium]|nr:T9SS type A sorting domain-containing protein [Ignavibacteriales bacterium]
MINPTVELVKKSWNKLQLRDAEGKSYTLYTTTDKSDDLSLTALPPVPPANMFDVRFASNRFAANLSSGAERVQMSGVVFPVTVSSEGSNVIVKANGKSMLLTNGSQISLTDNSIAEFSVEAENSLPVKFDVAQNFPNPFNPSTTIKFSVPKAANVKISVYNSMGELVSELVNASFEAGSYSVKWDAARSASGLYFYRMEAGDFISVNKMLLLK